MSTLFGMVSMTGYVTQLQFQKASGFAWKIVFDTSPLSLEQIFSASVFVNFLPASKKRCLELVVSGIVTSSKILAMMRDDSFWMTKLKTFFAGADKSQRESTDPFTKLFTFDLLVFHLNPALEPHLDLVELETIH